MHYTTQPVPIQQPHRNHGLFSDHYLNETLPQRSDWRELADEAKPVMDELKRVLERYGPVRGEKEARTEKYWVRPVLEALGHAAFEERPSLKVPGDPQEPDYVFYNSQGARDSKAGLILDEDLLRGKAYAVGDAKRWDRRLDMALKEGSDPFTNKNPSYQISFYMQHTGMEWGILTNGRLWRLYHRSSSYKLDHYYQVDLPELLTSDNVGAFLYFYAFFHRSAFEDHPLSVRAILEQSTVYARSIGDSLKTQVYEALRHLAQGFLDYPNNGLETDPKTLREIYDNSLIVLYRLLFVLYAESRDLLPVREGSRYRDVYSLHKIKHDVADDLDAERVLLPDSDILWPRLKGLSRIINDGSPPLNVATFDGGLFHPEQHPFLERYIVGDKHLQQAVDKLARVDRQFVDYRDLAERHLGTIYEGLLEFRLERLPEPEEDFTVVLLNHKGKRKATGSYYTRDYIVKYIVEVTVGPALEKAIEDVQSGEEKVAAVLALNVLDPSMGSGHFLVEATEYVARFLVKLNVAPDEVEAGGETELAYWKRRVVQSCVYGVDTNPLAVNLAKLSLWLATVAEGRPLSFLDHHLRCGNSLVGSRISDLRPGGTRKKGRRTQGDGDSQLTMIEDPAFRDAMSTAVGSMWRIEESPAETVEEVRQQESIYTELHRDLTSQYVRLANLITATHFGVKADIYPEFWSSLVQYAALDTEAAAEAASKNAALKTYREWLDAAAEVAEEQRFFQWELAFPEVYFDRWGQPLDDPGFDVVVGNPPYVRQERLRAFKPYFQENFDTHKSGADLYMLFYEQGLRLLGKAGRLAYISSGTFARADFATEFRKLLPITAQIESVIDFGEKQPFEGAEMVRPTIMALKKGRHEAPFRSLLIFDEVPQSLEQALSDDGVDSDPAALQLPEWVFQPATLTRLFIKIREMGRPLQDVVDGRMHRGVLTGLNEAFIIDQATRDDLIDDDPSCADVIKPVLRGEDLRPWYQEDEGRWLIVLPSGWTHAQFGSQSSEDQAWEQFHGRHPALATHLRPFADAARKRQDKGEYWWELRPMDYYEAFEEPKIFWPDIAKLPRYSWDNEGKFINNKGYIIPDADPALLGIMQSRVLWFAVSQVSQVCQPLRLRAGLWQYQMFTQFTSRLPIPYLSSTDADVIGTLAMKITDRARARYQVHHRARHRILSDLGTNDKTLNQKLMAWWNLEFPTFRAEVKRRFDKDIPIAEHDEWEEWLAEQRVEHEQLTAKIVRLETDLNARVYTVFDLTPSDIRTIEKSTKYNTQYRYGEV